jgi:TctA family transporter
MLHFGTPELLALCIFGLSMVATLSGPFPLRGLTAACVGLLIAMVGIDPQLGIERFTFGDYYLWDGVPLGPFTLGLFAVPELAALMIARRRVSETAGPKGFSLAGQYQGLRDVLHHWWLMLRCAWLGRHRGARHRRVGDRLDRLRPRGADRKTPRPSAPASRRHRLGIGEQCPRGGR